MTPIPSITVPALVISMSGNLFLDPENSEIVTGKLIPVPCRDILYDNTDMWAIPIKDSGIFTGLDFELKVGDYLAKPTFDSFDVFRIRDTKSDTYWIIYGTKEDLLKACAACCDDAPVPMPGVAGIELKFAPCSIVNLTDGDGNPYMVFGLPSLEGAETFFPVGAHNNVAYPTSDPAGYSSIATLLTFLNANYTPYTWTASGDELTLIGTGGALDDILCVAINRLEP